MIIDSNNKQQINIITNKCFYQAIARVMHELEKKGYPNAADETTKLIAAYHSLVDKKSKNNYSKDYNNAFKYIDEAIENIAHQAFFMHESKKFDVAYKAFKAFDHINAIVKRQHVKNAE